MEKKRERERERERLNMPRKTRSRRGKRAAKDEDDHAVVVEKVFFSLHSSKQSEVFTEFGRFHAFL